MSIFERYLTLWVALCIVVGIALGQFFPGLFQAIGAAEIAKVNLPVAVLIWLMIIPMLLKIDFAALRPGRQPLARHRRDAVHQLGGQAVLDGAARLAVHRLAVPALPAGRPDRQLHRRPDHPGRRALHGDGVRLVEPDQGRAAFHAEPGGAQRRDHGRRLRADRRRCCSACRRSPCRGTRCCCRSALYIVVPVIVAQVLRRRLLASGGDGRARRGCSACCSRSRSSALLATLVLLFGFQGEQIIAQPLVIALLAVPILIQVYFNSGLAYLLNRVSGEQHCVAGPVGADRRLQLLRTGGRRRHQPVRLQLRRGAGDRGRRAGRGAGDAVGGLDREPLQGLVRARRRGAARRRRTRERGRMTITIYHNPDCGTSRNTLAMIRQSGRGAGGHRVPEDAADRGAPGQR